MKKKSSLYWLIISFIFLYTYAFFYVFNYSDNKSIIISKNLSDSLSEGLNIIAIDLGGEENSNRASGAYGDCTIIEQNGNYLIIDVGTDDENDVLIKYLKKQGIKRFSIYISHYHSDHYGKIMDIIDDKYFKINTVYLPDTEIMNSKYVENTDGSTMVSGNISRAKDLIAKINEKSIKVVPIRKGSTINIGEAKLEVIWDLRDSNLNVQDLYDKDKSNYSGLFLNDASLVSMIEYKGVKYLTAGDIEKEVESDIIKNVGKKLEADIFKLSHHGSFNSNTSAIIEMINPTFAYYPNNYEKGENVIKWVKERGIRFQNALAEFDKKINLLSTLYNGNIMYHISPDGKITTKATRNYHTVTIKYLDYITEKEISDSMEYHFNDQSACHLERLNKIKEYKFVNCLNSEDKVLDNDAEINKDTTIRCRYRNENDIYGDVDGNGKVEIVDYLKVRKHILSKPKLEGVELKRADVNGKDGVTTADYIEIRKIILNI